MSMNQFRSLIAANAREGWPVLIQQVRSVAPPFADAIVFSRGHRQNGFWLKFN
jgi:hypothetical protein